MAKYSVVNNIGVIAVDNPPVNALSLKARKGLAGYIKVAEKDANVSAIIICGNGRTFPVGADISEFNSEAAKASPDLSEVVTLLDFCKKPTVAAIHGYALGGGLEIALGCHYRVALSSARFGLPEVKLGILPGAGGTQRLPRIIGLDAAMRWIIYGEEYTARTATSLGLIDKIYSPKSNIVQCAIEFSHSIIGKDVQRRRISCMKPKDSGMSEILVSKYMQELSKKSKKEVAPFKCLKVINQTSILDFHDGIKVEKDTMEYLMSSGQSKALRYAFYGERQAHKWTNSAGSTYKNSSPVNVKKAAVIGLGTMGTGIAISLAKLGIPVFVLELDDKVLEISVKLICTIIHRMYLRGEITHEQSQKMQSVLLPTNQYADLKDVDVVIEAVFESMELKKEIFRKLDKFCKKSAILATNTSALDIDEIASVTKRPQQVLGMHFFAPAHRMRLLENVSGSQASAQTIATGMDVGKRMGKVTVLVGNCEGFVGNRMYMHYLCESDFMLEEGAYPEEIDAALKDFGFPMGRYEVGDLSGNDVLYKVRFGKGLTRKQQPDGADELSRNGIRYCPLSDIMHESGRYGHKANGKGWFKYDNRQPCIDLDVVKMIQAHRKYHHIHPRKIHIKEILERMLYSMINEGFKILEEGIASCPSDIDMIWIYGYSWPKHTGGPMYYAHTVGLPTVLEVIEQKWRSAGATEPHWEPSNMLKNLVRNYGNPKVADWMNLTQGSVKSAL